jgi:iron-sulfur cluster repair protein YtfE (RIC family)
MATGKQGTPEIFNILKQDHQEVTQLMNKLAKGGDREALIAQLNQELSQHMRQEETHFYPVLQQAGDEELRELVEESIAEHTEIKQLLGQVVELEAGSNEWNTRFAELREGKENHVDEEENELFPLCQRILKAEQLDAIAQKVTAEKEKSQKRTTKPRGRKRPEATA